MNNTSIYLVNKLPKVFGAPKAVVVSTKNVCKLRVTKIVEALKVVVCYKSC